MLAALAEATDRIRLGCMVGPTSHRIPALLAKMATTIDIVTEGRLELGLGAGWYTIEREAYDPYLPGKFHKSFDVFDESVQIIHSLMTNSRTSFEGIHFMRWDAPFEPKGPQSPPPVTIESTGLNRTLRAVGLYTDWWNIPFLKPGSYLASVDALFSHCADAGWDPFHIRRSANEPILENSSVEQTVAEMGAAIGAGIDQPIAYIQRPFSFAQMAKSADAGIQLGLDHR